MERVKLLKKVRKKRAQFLASEPEMHVTFLDDTITESSTLNPISDEYHFFIGNGGTRNGISREVLTVLLGKVDSIYMPESKDFSFATVTGKRDVRRLLKNCNGICVQDTCKIRGLCHLISPSLLKGPPLHLYLSLVDCIPTSYEKVSDALEFPPGLFLFPEFISEVEERQLLNYFSPSTSGQCTLSTGLTSPQDSITKACPVSISPYHLTPGTYPTSLGSCTTDQSSIRDSVTKSCLVKEKPTENDCASSPNLPPTPYHAASSSQPTPSPVVSTLKHRRVSHYGYEFLYGSNRVDPEQPLPGGLPAVCTPLLERMREQGLLEWLPDQLTANDYLPGAGESKHGEFTCVISHQVFHLMLILTHLLRTRLCLSVWGLRYSIFNSGVSSP